MEVKDPRPSLLNRIMEDPKLALLSLAAITLLLSGLVWISFSGAPRLAAPKDNPYAAARKNQSSKLSLFAWNLAPGWAKDLARSIFSWGGSNAWADSLDAQSLARKNGFGLKGGKGSQGEDGGYLEGSGPGGSGGEYGEGGEWEIGPDGQKRRRGKSRGEGGAGGDYSANAMGLGSFEGADGAYAGSARFDGIGMAGGGRDRGGISGGADRAGGTGRVLARRGSTNEFGLGAAKFSDRKMKGIEEAALPVKPEKPKEFKPSPPPAKLTRASPGGLARVLNGVAGARESVKNKLIADNLQSMSQHASRISDMAPRVQRKVNKASAQIVNDMTPLRQAENTMLLVPSRFGKYGLTTSRDLPNLEQLPRLAEAMKYHAGSLNNVKSAADKARSSANDLMRNSFKPNDTGGINQTRAESMPSHLDMEHAFSQFESADRAFWDVAVVHQEKIWQPWQNTIATFTELDGLIKNTLIPKKTKLEKDLRVCREKYMGVYESCRPIERELKITTNDLVLAQQDRGIVDDARARFQSQNLSVNGSGSGLGIYSEFRAVQKAWEPERREYVYEAKYTGALAGNRGQHKSDIEENGLSLDLPDVKNLVPVIGDSQKDLISTQQNMQYAAETGTLIPRVNDPSVWSAQKPPGVPEQYRRVNDPTGAVYAARADGNAVEAALNIRQEELHLELHKEAAIKQEKIDAEFKKQQAEDQRRYAKEMAIYQERDAAYQNAARAKCAATSVSGAACP